MKPFGAQKGHVVDFLFTLALFCVFAASALMVVVIVTLPTCTGRQSAGWTAIMTAAPP